MQSLYVSFNREGLISVGKHESGHQDGVCNGTHPGGTQVL